MSPAVMTTKRGPIERKLDRALARIRQATRDMQDIVVDDPEHLRRVCANIRHEAERMRTMLDEKDNPT
jgi:hypothetical protein